MPSSTQSAKLCQRLSQKQKIKAQRLLIRGGSVRPLGRVADAYGGSERIRTSETVASPHDFESCAFNHSATLPLLIVPYFSLLLN